MHRDIASVLLLSVCIYAGSDDVIVFLTSQQGSEPGQIKTVNITSGVKNTLQGFKIVKPEALVYDEWTDRIYWTDIKTKEIRSARSNGSDEQHVFDFDAKAIPEGLALDPISRQLFYTDTGNDRIGVVALESPHHAKIIVDGYNIQRPRGIAIHSRKRLIVWTDWQAWAAIEVASISGEGRRSLVNTDLTWPNAVTVDETSDVVFWCDAHTKTIESIHIDGTRRRRLLEELNTHFYGIYLFEDTFYVSDWLARALKLLYLNGTKYRQIADSSFANISQPFAARVSRCPDGRYGENCTECGKCRDGEMCNKLTGLCLHGCEPGYFDSFNNGSRDDVSGRNLSMCNRMFCYCKDNAGCPDNVCPHGCQAGWTGPACSVECPNGTFGINCRENCSHCEEPDTCDRYSGHCPHGCKDGWKGANCNATTNIDDDSENTASNTSKSANTTGTTSEVSKTSTITNKHTTTQSTPLTKAVLSEDSGKGTGESSRFLVALTVILGILVICQTIVLWRYKKRHRRCQLSDKNMSNSGSDSTCNSNITCLDRADKCCQVTDSEDEKDSLV